MIKYDTSNGLSQLHTDSNNVSRHKLYEVYINPPKGTTDNLRWAEEIFMKATKMGFPALIVRPAQNVQEGTSLDYSPQTRLEVISEALRDIPIDELQEVVVRLRERVRKEQAGAL